MDSAGLGSSPKSYLSAKHYVDDVTGSNRKQSGKSSDSSYTQIVKEITVSSEINNINILSKTEKSELPQRLKEATKNTRFQLDAGVNKLNSTKINKNNVSSDYQRLSKFYSAERSSETLSSHKYSRTDKKVAKQDFKILLDKFNQALLVVKRPNSFSSVIKELSVLAKLKELFSKFNFAKVKIENGRFTR